MVLRCPALFNYSIYARYAMATGRIPTPTSIRTPLSPLQLFPPNMPPISSLWQGTQLQQYLKSLLENIDLLKAVTSELEAISLIKNSGEITQQACSVANPSYDSGPGTFVDNGGILENDGKDQNLLLQGLVKLIKKKWIDLNTLQCMSLDAGQFLQATLKNQLAPLDAVINQGRWEERSAAVRLADKRLKTKRNQRWRKKQRQRYAEALRKEHERYEQADKGADDWRAREIARDIARRKVEKMKGIAKIKAKEEKQRLESELELVLIVEKLQELRSIRIQKLKKQGHFLPEEDNKFLERVRAAVEEEERQAAAAADTRAATDAIANAEECRKSVGSVGPEVYKEELSNANQRQAGEEKIMGQRQLVSETMHRDKNDGSPLDDRRHEAEGNRNVGHDALGSLPPEFYHYYHGSNADMGTLIEVRRTWDAFIMPGGSQIPSHWVQPPPPADQVWASYLVQKGNQHKCK